MSILFRELSYQVIGASFTVLTRLGCSLPESCYEQALMLEFARLGIPAVHQQYFDVYYDGARVGHMYLDIIVDNSIVLELKSADRIISLHESQLLTYLRVSKLRVGYIVNFGYKSLQFRRMVL